MKPYGIERRANITCKYGCCSLGDGGHKFKKGHGGHRFDNHPARRKGRAKARALSTKLLKETTD